MTDAVIVALTMAVPTTVIGLGNLLVALKNGKKADQNGAMSLEIKHSVNSAATAARDEITALRHELESMRTVAAERKEIAALLAQATAARAPLASDPVAEPIPVVVTNTPLEIASVKKQ